MYISGIEIKNFRSFDNINIDFHEGVNVLIGHNNSGKSNLLRALAIIFDRTVKKQLSVEDFNNSLTIDSLKKQSPKIVITVRIKQSENEDLMTDELITVSNWLTKLEEPYEAKIQYEFFLPISEEKNYVDTVNKANNKEEIWNIIRSQFIRLYISKIWGGNPENQVPIDNDNLNKFDFQFLDAIRDVERDMFSGRNTLLKSVIDFFLDYDIKSDKNITEEEQKMKLQERKDIFSTHSSQLIKNIQERLDSGNQEILSYIEEIGASYDKSTPDFEGQLSESEIYMVLQLIVRQTTGMSIPITHNGLGYNNLIFMALLLSKMQADSDGEFLGSNAKVFPILAIEEPEAHLHPTMQNEFIKFLKNNIKDKKVKQIFITTHSTHISSSTNIDDIICLYKKNDIGNVSYPGRILGENNIKSKKYVQRFLDATKSNMLFAEKIIFVEGLAEQLLLNIFAEYLGKSLEKNHVAVINVGGRYFEHFLHLFDSNNKGAIDRKVSCITDLDPVRKCKTKNNYKACYPFEYNMNLEEFDYSTNDLLNEYEDEKHNNIRAFVQSKKYGKTFEYQLILDNPSLKLLLTESIANKKELIELMNLYSSNATFSELINTLSNSHENNRIKESLKNTNIDWNEEQKKKALIASRYLNSVGKGENALELASVLKDNLELKNQDEYQEFIVPEYIANAIEWVCE
ncbi:AAA family ATPase [Staphylococcus haemolyticus]|uniref:ATP-dependent nuclease n=1 Tax=Staphylococcus TaxID=1279 RepID=UPI001F5782F7|nr:MULTISPECIES: AAA family ATPase [Staphylococcus]MCI2915416.1 AAA family ATPase [Staphylococcus hominis]MCW9139159.1 AAA family ATPase [Staphylococcus haemolyticus]MCW9141792.1 AAA family ATPase [Staphylococcus sp. SUC_1.2]MDU0567480.1 AAA family ATPase [Staphylococcus haemolyticus]MEB7347977.1 AAA family ATPase [Staphylococcus haemolyticus]